ncbi:MAG: hypothetical protein RLZZ557_1210, partial [Bacteroidota bacterium]
HLLQTDFSHIKYFGALVPEQDKYIKIMKLILSPTRLDHFCNNFVNGEAY